MKRRVWLGLALAGCVIPVTGAVAQDSRIVPPASDVKPSAPKTVEPGKPLVTQEGATTTTVTSEGVIVQEPTFSERWGGFREAVFTPLTFSWFDEFTGAGSNLMTSDIEDPYWAKMELLFARFKDASAPPLLTTSLPQSSQGILGNEGTRVLFGDTIDLQNHLGFKAAFGFWLQPAQTWGFEGKFFSVFNKSNQVRFLSQGDPLLANPFYDSLANAESAYIIAREAGTGVSQVAGNVHVGTHSRTQGFEFNNIHNVLRGTRGRLDWTWGYRYFYLDEAIYNEFFQEDAPAIGQQFGVQRLIWDDFGTSNNFHGINFGLRSQWYAGCWTFDINAQLAFGFNSNTVEINGTTLSASPPNFQLVTSRGGIYALESNIGKNNQVGFSVVPEIELGVGYYFCEYGRIYLNYDFLAITGVVRPGDQIDRRINPNILDGNGGNPATPEPFHNKSTFWMSTLAVGIELRY
jgi:hypothetical protein